MNTLSDPDPRRRALVLALLSGGVAGLAGCATGGSVRPDTFPPDRSIFRLQGEVLVQDRPATLDTPVPPGSTIRTGADAYVIFVAGMDAFLLRADTEFTLPGPPTGSVPPRFSLPRGRVLSVFASRRLDLATPQAIVGVRGTGVYVEARPGSAYVCTCYGATSIEAVSDPGVSRLITARHHDAPVEVLDGGDGTVRIVDALFADHDDEELLLLETLVGRTPPFFVPGGIQRALRRYG